MFTKEKIYILVTYNQTQIQPIIGRQFMVSPCIIPCYKIIPIKNSIRAQDDKFSTIQKISINSYKEIIQNSRLIDEFERLF